MDKVHCRTSWLFQLNLKDFNCMIRYEIEKLHALIRHNVKALREKKGKSQLEIALGIGHASAAFYAKAEHGIQNKKFNIEHLCKIAEILDVDIREFFNNHLNEENY